jgi:hypothetical protein
MKTGDGAKPLEELSDTERAAHGALTLPELHQFLDGGSATGWAAGSPTCPSARAASTRCGESNCSSPSVSGERLQSNAAPNSVGQARAFTPEVALVAVLARQPTPE